MARVASAEAGTGPGPAPGVAAGTAATAGAFTGAGRRRPAVRAAFIAITLFFTFGPLVNLLQQRPDPAPFLLLLSGWAVFGLVLRQLFRNAPFGRPEDSRFLLAALVYLAAIGFVTQAAFGVAEAAAMYYYAGVSAARVVPEAWSRLAIAAVALVAGIGTTAASGNPSAGLTVAVTVGTISLTLSALSALRRANLELHAARLELADAAVAEERVRIARDLHDTLGHSLSLIALKSELARRVLPDDPARAAQEITDVERTAREALASVRETVGGYRQPSLAVELARAGEALRAAGIDATVESAPAVLPREVEILLGWAVREGVTNVMRHSGARSATIRLVADGPVRGVEILDDGRGGATGAVPTGGGATRHATDGYGLAGLGERASRLGGRVDAGARTGGGFRLLVSVPVEDPA